MDFPLMGLWNIWEWQILGGKSRVAFECVMFEMSSDIQEKFMENSGREHMCSALHTEGS